MSEGKKVRMDEWICKDRAKHSAVDSWKEENSAVLVSKWGIFVVLDMVYFCYIRYVGEFDIIFRWGYRVTDIGESIPWPMCLMSHEWLVLTILNIRLRVLYIE